MQPELTHGREEALVKPTNEQINTEEVPWIGGLSPTHEQLDGFCNVLVSKSNNPAGEYSYCLNQRVLNSYRASTRAFPDFPHRKAFIQQSFVQGHLRAGRRARLRRCRGGGERVLASQSPQCHAGWIRAPGHRDRRWGASLPAPAVACRCLHCSMVMLGVMVPLGRLYPS